MFHTPSGSLGSIVSSSPLISCIGGSSLSTSTIIEPLEEVLLLFIGEVKVVPMVPEATRRWPLGHLSNLGAESNITDAVVDGISWHFTSQRRWNRNKRKLHDLGQNSDIVTCGRHNIWFRIRRRVRIANVVSDPVVRLHTLQWTTSSVQCWGLGIRNDTIR